MNDQYFKFGRIRSRGSNIGCVFAEIFSEPPAAETMSDPKKFSRRKHVTVLLYYHAELYGGAWGSDLARRRREFGVFFSLSLTLLNGSVCGRDILNAVRCSYVTYVCP